MVWDDTAIAGIAPNTEYLISNEAVITSTSLVLPPGANLSGAITGNFLISAPPPFGSYACAKVSATCERITSVIDIRPIAYGGAPREEYLATEDDLGLIELADEA